MIATLSKRMDDLLESEKQKIFSMQAVFLNKEKEMTEDEMAGWHQ